MNPGGSRGEGPAGDRDSGGIVLEKLCKSYQGRAVLSDFSCVFPKGEVSGIMAPSGRGKTTLLRILMGLERPDSGSVRGLCGMRMSAVFQEDRLCPFLDAEANIRLVRPDLPSDMLRDALKELGLDKEKGKAAEKLSGGMRRRTALLRALLAEWDILFLDEPFKGLDEGTKRDAIAFTKRMVSLRTVLFVTHDEREIAEMGCRCVRL